MMTLTIDDLKVQNLILLECISGSRAYGLDTPTSDIDIKGVFYLPKSYYYGLNENYIAQISNDTNDIVYYELGRFIELLLQNNPNTMELLATPDDKVLYRHQLLSLLKPEWFISKLCEKTFAGFAQSQIKKSRGLNKKIVNPMPKDGKSILDFCVIFEQGKSIGLMQWLQSQGLSYTQLGLASMPHATQMYAVYVDRGDDGFGGVVKNLTATQLTLSSIPKGLPVVAYLSFNQMGFSKYCQDYQDYWQWVENRNETRYQSTLEHGKQYDAKNMMHAFRLLQMALDIANTGKVLVRRDNRDELLAIKSGRFEYDDLLYQSDELINAIHTAFEHSSLPNEPNKIAVLSALVAIRNTLYQS